MKLLLIFILCSAFIAFKPDRIAESIVRRPEKVTAAAVQTTNGFDFASTTSTIITYNSNTSVGSIVVIAVLINSGQTVTSVTDDASNSFTIGSSVTSSDGKRIYLAWAYQDNGAAEAYIDFSASTSGVCMMDEYSGFTGLTTASVSDGTTTGSGTGTNLSVSTLTPSAAGKLIVSAGHSSNGILSSGSGFTLYGEGSAGGLYIQTQYKLVGAATETCPMTSAGSGDWAEIARAFTGPEVTGNTGGFFNFFKP